MICKRCKVGDKPTAAGVAAYNLGVKGHSIDVEYGEAFSLCPDSIPPEVRAEIEQAVLVRVRTTVDGLRMVGPSPIGPLHYVGWNCALEELLKRLESQESAAK